MGSVKKLLLLRLLGLMLQHPKPMTEKDVRELMPDVPRKQIHKLLKHAVKTEAVVATVEELRPSKFQLEVHQMLTTLRRTVADLKDKLAKAKPQESSSDNDGDDGSSSDWSFDPYRSTDTSDSDVVQPVELSVDNPRNLWGTPEFDTLSEPIKRMVRNEIEKDKQKALAAIAMHEQRCKERDKRCKLRKQGMLPLRVKPKPPRGGGCGGGRGRQPLAK